jgi:hypothetical protein
MTTRAILVGLAGACILAACSSPSGSNAPTASASSPSRTSSGAPSQRGPAASGTIAAITGTTMQVQNEQTGQVAVTWTSFTKFTHQVSATIAAVKAGNCVTAIAPSGTSGSAASFTAISLAVSKPVGRSCTGNVANSDGQRPSGSPSLLTPGGSMASGSPSGLPRDAGGAVVTGTVRSVSGTTLVIAARQPGSNATANKTVTVGPRTKITADAETTARSLRVGKCVSAQGKTDSSGAVTATSVWISDPVNRQCGGFGRFEGGGTGG